MQGMRFTPTCVGKSGQFDDESAHDAVHPHVCGEIITSSLRLGFGPVHPHVCGEITVARMVSIAPLGSPPRVWGNLRRCRYHPDRVRFTPTCVGKSTCARPMRTSPTVHPHVCGEICDGCHLIVRLPGSPPRVWGNRQRGDPDPGHARFTPTCVGKSRMIPGSAPWITGSPPRVWGNRSLPRRGPAGGGSPPRVWGNRQVFPQTMTCGRFTPTCVGKSFSAAPGGQCPSVHPHVCGEITRSPAIVTSRVGSPPRVWGNLAGHAALGGFQRFTPTCVGKS